MTERHAPSARSAPDWFLTVGRKAQAFLDLPPTATSPRRSRRRRLDHLKLAPLIMQRNEQRERHGAARARFPDPMDSSAGVAEPPAPLSLIKPLIASMTERHASSARSAPAGSMAVGRETHHLWTAHAARIPRRRSLRRRVDQPQAGAAAARGTGAPPWRASVAREGKHLGPARTGRSYPAAASAVVWANVPETVPARVVPLALHPAPAPDAERRRRRRAWPPAARTSRRLARAGTRAGGAGARSFAPWRPPRRP